MRPLDFLKYIYLERNEYLNKMVDHFYRKSISDTLSKIIHFENYFQNNEPLDEKTLEDMKDTRSYLLTDIFEKIDINMENENCKDEKYIYDLFAVANHMGGLHGGHYYAYCKNCKDGEWYEFNDSNVEKIDKNKIVTENAYVLFYNRKRENKINEEELFKKPFINIDHTKYI